MALKTRAYPLRPHAPGEAYSNSAYRFNVVPAGRRSGKTERAKRKVVGASFGDGPRGASTYDDPAYFCAAPTRDQAKAIYWNDIKKLVPPDLRVKTSESDLMIRTVAGSEIWVVGMDKPERIEGRPWDGGILDEYGNMKPGAWGENVRPALSDRLGWCDLIGVPEGRNHYFDIAEYAQHSNDPDWAMFTWFSSDILPPGEIAAAKRQLDALVYQQEYEASFVNFTGRAYYPFASLTHCATLKYDPRRALALCFDFNVDPGVCAIVQEQQLPGQFERSPEGVPLLNRPIWGTGVIAEVWIPQNSNTPAVCRKVIELFGNHRGPVICYGDATGGARGSAKVQGSDWDLIKATLLPAFGENLGFKVPSANPAERARVNAMNSRLKNTAGEIRCMVDRGGAPHVVTDLEGVTTLAGGSGELDKKANPMLTHISDALGYYVAREFPIANNQMVAVPVAGT
jgi:hypothetical protein